MEILQVCDQFCKMVSMWDNKFFDVHKTELLELKAKSNSLIEMLLHIIYSLHEKSTGHHLLQLLQYIDFNRWFSKNISNLNLSGSY